MGDLRALDLEAKLSSPAAGQVGIPVDATCVGCGQTRVKRADPEEMGHHPQVDPTAREATDLASFTHTSVTRVTARRGGIRWRS